MVKTLFKTLESISMSPAATILAVIAHAGFHTLVLVTGRGELVSFTALALLLRLLLTIGRKNENKGFRIKEMMHYIKKSMTHPVHQIDRRHLA